MKSAPYISIRFLRKGLIDTIMTTIGIALAGSVLAACFAVIGAFDTRARMDIEAPWYREIIVLPAPPDAVDENLPVAKVENQERISRMPTAADLIPSKEASPLVSHAYVMSFSRMGVGLGSSGQVTTSVSTLPGGGTAISKGMIFATGPGTENLDVRIEAGNEPGAKADDVMQDSAGDLFGEPVRLGLKATENGEAGIEGEEPLPMDFREMEAALESLKQEAEALEKPLIDEVQTAQVSPEFFGAYELSIEKGSLISQSDIDSGLRTAVVGAGLAGKLYTDGLVLGKKIMLNGTVYTIIGVLAESGYFWRHRQVSLDDLIYLPFSAGAFRVGRSTTAAWSVMSVPLLRYAVAESGDLEAAVGQIGAWFGDTYGEERLSIESPVDEFLTEIQRQKLILAVLAALAGAGMLIAGLNLFNLMTTRVLRRTRSVGILRSLGASRKEVFGQFLFEAGIISIAGMLLAFAVSPLIFGLLAGFTSDGYDLRPEWLILGLLSGFAGLISIAAAIIPAVQASRTVIVDAIRG